MIHVKILEVILHSNLKKTSRRFTVLVVRQGGLFSKYCISGVQSMGIYIIPILLKRYVYAH